MTGSAAGAVLEQSSSRRSLLVAAGVAATGGSAAMLAACSTRPPKKPPVASPGVRPGALRADVGLLNSALDLEHAAIAAYTAGIPLLSRPAIDMAKLFLAQEVSHASELSALIHQGGGKPNPPAASYDLGHPRRAEDVLALLHTIERMTIGAYLETIPKLSHGAVRSTVASILANEAEHISLLRTALGRQPVPSAFVTASE